jgi:hypothetical protein
MTLYSVSFNNPSTHNQSWGFGVLGFWRFGVLAFWRFGNLVFWRFGVLTFWRLGAFYYLSAEFQPQ